ncbi:MAG: hypothetical protein GY698_21465 [Actinomycetia bacterium]|nr:hypothetical protein [Actinomycetes bacterium]
MTETASERRARWMSVGVSATATPTRSAEVVEIGEREGRWATDGDAYRRIRKAGLQPDKIDGSAELERRL